MSDDLNFENVELNLSNLLSEDLHLDLPIRISKSYAKSLKIAIPWTSLLSTPIGIYIDNLELVLETISEVCGFSMCLRVICIVE